MTKPGLPVSERFWSKVDRREYAPGGCWLWLGGKDKIFFDKNRRSVKAHIFSFILSGGVWLKKAKALFRCSNKPCVQPAHIYVQSDEERFWLGVDKSSGPTGCWTWKKSKQKSGVGKFEAKKYGAISAHRYAFIVSGGILTKKRPWVLHKCHEFGFYDNPSCCNPLHLRAGTPAENVQDSIKTGTHRQIRKTSCPKGHPLSDGNLTKRRLKLGHRECKACATQRSLISTRIRRGWDPTISALAPSTRKNDA